VGDYPLTQLGTAEFEHMSQSLLAALVGPSNVKVYGAGRDGGPRADHDHSVRA
jgi:hypothetical protein